MYIQDRPIYDKILAAKRITILSYHTYPVGTTSKPYIAQDTANVFNQTHRPSIENSALVNKVDLLINEGIALCFYSSRSNKEAVCCQIGGIDKPVYFVAYDLQRIFCWEISDRRGSKTVLIQEKNRQIMPEIKIEKNVPKPIMGVHTFRSKKGSGPYAVLGRMGDGDSVFIPAEAAIAEGTVDEAKMRVSAFKTAAKWTPEMRINREFTFAEVDEGTPPIKGVRIWLDYKVPDEKKK